MEPKFKIEDGHEIPEGCRYRSSKYGFNDMEVGQSFEFPHQLAKQVQWAANSFKIRSKNFNYMTRRTGPETYRLWRIEPKEQSK